MAFALSAVEEIELKRQAALVGCQEFLLVLSVVDRSYSSLKWHTKAIAVRLHLPRHSRPMTECSCVR